MKTLRVLYSFPHRIGVGRICDTAWHQVRGATAAGAEIVAFPASIGRELPAGVSVVPTLARGRFRLPYRLVGDFRAIAAHDRIVARRLPKLAGRIDLVHTWPLGALETLQAAARLGIPTVLERPNAHTRFAYEVVRSECERLGVELPPDHEHAYNEGVLRKEEAEYELADFLLCPSEFVLRTFLDRGIPEDKLVRHVYGFDPAVFHPNGDRAERDGLVALFVGVAAVRKGLHFALDAWLASSASERGTFLIAGDILPAYAEHLGARLAHPSVRVLGHRSDVAELMRTSDMLLLPSLEEGSALACSEALGSGCVPLVSEAASGVCSHGVNALVHPVGDVASLRYHITLIDNDHLLLGRLRENAKTSAAGITWDAAGERLADIYRSVLRAP